MKLTPYTIETQYYGSEMLVSLVMLSCLSAVHTGQFRIYLGTN